MEQGKVTRLAFLSRIRQKEKVYLSHRNLLREAFIASFHIVQRKQNWPMCCCKDNLLFRDPEFIGSSPTPLEEIGVIQKVPGKSSYDREGRKGSLM